MEKLVYFRVVVWKCLLNLEILDKFPESCNKIQKYFDTFERSVKNLRMCQFLNHFISSSKLFLVWIILFGFLKDFPKFGKIFWGGFS